MIKIIFKYDIKKDAYNWTRRIIFQPSFGIKKDLSLVPKDLIEKINRSFKKNKISHQQFLSSMKHPSINLMTKYLKKTQDAKEIIAIKSELEKSWRKVEKEYFKVLSKILEKPIYKSSYVCYLTTQYGCPYNEKESWFMVSTSSKLSTKIYIICHEFMHLQFLHYYRKYCLKKGLDENKTQDLKEALTFILNEREFKKIISFKDKGYPNHQQLRIKLKKCGKKIEILKTF